MGGHHNSHNNFSQPIRSQNSILSSLHNPNQHMQSHNYFHNHMRSDIGHQSYNDKGGNHNYEYSPQRFDHLKSQTDGFVDSNIENNNNKYDNNTNNNNNIPNQNSNT